MDFRKSWQNPILGILQIRYRTYILSRLKQADLVNTYKMLSRTENNKEHLSRWIGSRLSLHFPDFEN